MTILERMIIRGRHDYVAGPRYGRTEATCGPFGQGAVEKRFYRAALFEDLSRIYDAINDHVCYNIIVDDDYSVLSN